MNFREKFHTFELISFTFRNTNITKPSLGLAMVDFEVDRLVEADLLVDESMASVDASDWLGLNIIRVHNLF